MTTNASDRWKKLAGIAVLVVVALVVWRLAVRLFEFVRDRWAARRSV